MFTENLVMTYEFIVTLSRLLLQKVISTFFLFVHFNPISL